MYVKIRRRHHAHQTYEYVDIVESVKVDGKVARRTLGSLGRRDQLPVEKIDGLIEHLRKLASPEGNRGIRLGDMRIEAVRDYGIVMVARQLWQQLGLDQLLAELPQSRAVPVEEAVFRMVVNRLSDPHSKLALVDWADEHGLRHRGWQGQVQWPSGRGDLDYHHYLRAMDCVHPHRQVLENQIFPRVTDLFSLPLRLVFYDLTSTYFEGNGVCELAEYGYSRDHRDDRAQVVVGLAVTQEGLPVTHRVFPGATADVTTFAPMAGELKERFGLSETVIVADRGMFSEANVSALEESGMKYILALRARHQLDGHAAVALADQAGLPRPKDPASEWEWREVAVRRGVRHVVVYSCFRALHDFEVRGRRLQRAREELRSLQRQATAKQLSVRTITARATRILVQHKCSRYFTSEAERGSFRFRVDQQVYRQQRRHDGIFVLQTNHPTLTPTEIVESYRQLQEVERAFRVLKSLIKVRPVFHFRDRRVETHIFICFLAYLVAKVLQQRLRSGGLEISVAQALDHLSRLKAVEHTWENQAVVVQISKPDAETAAVLQALGVRVGTPVLSVVPRAAA